MPYRNLYRTSHGTKNTMFAASHALLICSMLIIIPLIASISYQAEPASGEIDGVPLSRDENWGGVVILDEDYLIASGETLTISPGTTILAASSVTITVQGTLIARGGPGANIFFDSQGEGIEWDGIRLEVSPTVSSESVSLSHCSIRSATTALSIQRTQMYFHHISIDHCDIGLSLVDGSTSHINDSTISNCDTALTSFGGISTLRDCTISATTSLDIVLDSNSQVEIWNTSIDDSKIEVKDPGSYLQTGWYLDVFVRDPYGRRAAGAKITVSNGTGSIVYTGFANDLGEVKGIQCPDDRWTGSGHRREMAYTISTQWMGLEWRTNFLLDSNSQVEISLRYRATLPEILREVSQDELFTSMSDLVAFGTRHTNTTQKYTSAAYLHHRLSTLPNVLVHYGNHSRWNVDFDDGSFTPYLELVNVVGELPGTDTSSDAKIYITAHYDTHSSIVPGADDDGSGVVALLEVMRILSQYQLNTTVVAAFFDAEEEGYLGSEALADNASANEENITFDFNVDMIGYRDVYEPTHCVIICNEDSEQIARRAKEVGDNALDNMDIQVKVDPAHRFSDHRSFWDNDYLAIDLAEDDYISGYNPYYHKPTDDIDIIDFPYLVNTTGLILATILDAAGVTNQAPLSPVNLSIDSTHARRPTISYYPAIDVNGDPIEYNLLLHNISDGTDVLSVSTSNTTYQVPMGLTYGTSYSISVLARDSTGKSSQASALEFTPQNGPPSISSISDVSIEQEQPLKIEVDVSDPDSDPIELKISSPPFSVVQMNSSCYLLSWTPSKGDVGDWSALLHASDGLGGADTEYFNVSVIDLPDAPELLTPLPDISFNEDAPQLDVLNLHEHFFDPDNRTLNFTFHSADPITGTISENGSLSLIPEPDWFGDTQGIIEVNDPFDPLGTGTTDIMNISVLPLNDPPHLDHIDNITVSEGEAVHIAPHATDVDDVDLQYSISGDIEALKWMVDVNAWEWLTTSDDAGTYSFNVSAHDGNLSDTQKFLVHVINVNHLPVAIIHHSTKLMEGESVKFDGTGSFDTDGEVVTWQWDLGDGTIDEGEVISHSFEKAGTYEVNLTVRDNDGDTDTKVISIEVEAEEGLATWLIISTIIIVVVMIVALIIMKTKMSRLVKEEIDVDEKIKAESDESQKADQDGTKDEVSDEEAKLHDKVETEKKVKKKKG